MNYIETAEVIAAVRRSIELLRHTGASNHGAQGYSWDNRAASADRKRSGPTRRFFLATLAATVALTRARIAGASGPGPGSGSGSSSSGTAHASSAPAVAHANTTASLAHMSSTTQAYCEATANGEVAMSQSMSAETVSSNRVMSTQSLDPLHEGVLAMSSAQTNLNGTSVASNPLPQVQQSIQQAFGVALNTTAIALSKNLNAVSEIVPVTSTVSNLYSGYQAVQSSSSEPGTAGIQIAVNMGLSFGSSALAGTAYTEASAFALGLAASPPVAVGVGVLAAGTVVLGGNLSESFATQAIGKVLGELETNFATKQGEIESSLYDLYSAPFTGNGDF